MRNGDSLWWVLALFMVGVMIFLIVSFTFFGVTDYRVVLINPTEEQLIDLYKTPENNRVWINGIHHVKGDASLQEAIIGVRDRDGGINKIHDLLYGLGIDHYITGKVCGGD